MLGCEKFILTGSNAVELHGIDAQANSKDLDIILINPTGAAVETLARFQTEHPNPRFNAQGGALQYSFFFEKVKVDVWIQKDAIKEEPLLSYDGVLIASLSAIVAAKKSYNRPKDFVQLMKWARSIFDSKTFTLDQINVSGQEYSA